MERLTTDRDYLVDKAEYERHLAQGYPRSTTQERFLKLCEYERTGHTPEEIAGFDQMYLAKCEEVNQLRAEMERLKGKPSDTQGDLISRQQATDALRVYADQKGVNGEVELANGILKAVCFLEKESNVPTAYDVDKVVEQIQNINTTWNCQECSHLEICDGIEKCGNEHLDLCAEVVKILSMDIVRAGGKE